jgi:hypothetical protein
MRLMEYEKNTWEIAPTAATHRCGVIGCNRPYIADAVQRRSVACSRTLNRPHILF